MPEQAEHLNAADVARRFTSVDEILDTDALSECGRYTTLEALFDDTQCLEAAILSNDNMLQRPAKDAEPNERDVFLPPLLADLPESILIWRDVFAPSTDMTRVCARQSVMEYLLLTELDLDQIAQLKNRAYKLKDGIDKIYSYQEYSRHGGKELTLRAARQGNSLAQEVLDEGITLVRDGLKACVTLKNKLKNCPHPVISDWVAQLEKIITDSQAFEADDYWHHRQEALDEEFSNQALAKKFNTRCEQFGACLEMSRLSHQHGLATASFKPDEPAAYTDGWNIAWDPEIQVKNPSPHDEPTVVYGSSNMSGKSESGLKQNFFFQLMAQSWGVVPATSANCRWYEGGAFYIDRVASNANHRLSAFGTEIDLWEQLLGRAAKHPIFACCVDEGFSTTSAEEQAQFLWGIQRYLRTQHPHSKSYLATHNETVIDWAVADPNAAVHHFKIDPSADDMFQYILGDGPQDSYALEVAERHGAPDLLLQIARAHLAGTPFDFEALPAKDWQIPHPATDEERARLAALPHNALHTLRSRHRFAYEDDERTAPPAFLRLCEDPDFFPRRSGHLPIAFQHPAIQQGFNPILNGSLVSREAPAQNPYGNIKTGGWGVQTSGNGNALHDFIFNSGTMGPEALWEQHQLLADLVEKDPYHRWKRLVEVTILDDKFGFFLNSTRFELLQTGKTLAQFLDRSGVSDPQVLRSIVNVAKALAQGEMLEQITAFEEALDKIDTMQAACEQQTVEQVLEPIAFWFKPIPEGLVFNYHQLHAQYEAEYDTFAQDFKDQLNLEKIAPLPAASDPVTWEEANTLMDYCQGLRRMQTQYVKGAKPTNLAQTPAFKCLQNRCTPQNPERLKEARLTAAECQMLIQTVGQRPMGEQNQWYSELQPRGDISAGHGLGSLRYLQQFAAVPALTPLLKNIATFCPDSAWEKILTEQADEGVTISNISVAINALSQQLMPLLKMIEGNLFGADLAPIATDLQRIGAFIRDDHVNADLEYYQDWRNNPVLLFGVIIDIMAEVTVNGDTRQNLATELRGCDRSILGPQMATHYQEAPMKLPELWAAAQEAYAEFEPIWKSYHAVRREHKPKRPQAEGLEAMEARYRETPADTAEQRTAIAAWCRQHGVMVNPHEPKYFTDVFFHLENAVKTRFTEILEAKLKPIYEANQAKRDGKWRAKISRSVDDIFDRDETDETGLKYLEMRQVTKPEKHEDFEYLMSVVLLAHEIANNPNYTAGTFNTDGVLEMNGITNLLYDDSADPHPQTPQSLRLDPTQTLALLRSPNMSGKTHFIKSVMANLLLHRATGFARGQVNAPLFDAYAYADRVTAKSKDEFSAFTTELHNRAELWRRILDLRQRCFVITDESYSTTSPRYQGALTYADATILSTHDQYGLMASHHGTAVARAKQDLNNTTALHLGFSHSDADGITFHRTIEPGFEASYAVAVARLLGFSEDVLAEVEALKPND